MKLQETKKKEVEEKEMEVVRGKKREKKKADAG
jgi:hypothetical protein